VNAEWARESWKVTGLMTFEFDLALFRPSDVHVTGDSAWAKISGRIIVEEHVGGLEDD